MTSPYAVSEESTPWGDPVWRERALTWIREQVAVVGMDAPRLRAWSITMRVRTSRGPVWFKANPPGSRFEAALTEALRIGVPDLRPGELPARFVEQVNSAAVRGQVGVPGGISAEQYAALTSVGPRLAQECAALAASAVPATLDHSDLHEGQAFVADDGRFVFFDWGDASIGHPFTSLLVVYRAADQRFGSRGLNRLRDAYLEPWTAEHPVGELRAAAELAVRLGAISRALSWGRVFPDAAHLLDAEHGQSVAHWLLRIAQPGLVTPRTL